MKLRPKVSLRRVHITALVLVALSGPAALVLHPERGNRLPQPVAESAAPPSGSPAATSPTSTPSAASGPSDRPSREPSASPTKSEPAIDASKAGSVTMSADGSILAFTLWDPGYRSRRKLYYRDRMTGRIVEFMRSPDDAKPNGDGGNPVVSSEGNRIAFESLGSNLVPNDDNQKTDVFVYDISSGRIDLVSVAVSGDGANGESWGASISADGRFVAFTSTASNLFPGDDNGESDVFVRDLQTKATTLVSATPSGGPGDGQSLNPSIDDTGNIVAFASQAADLTNDDTDAAWDVFVRDVARAETMRIPIESVRADARAGWAVAISPNGRFVGLAACPPGSEIGCRAYAYDRETGTLSFEDSERNASYTDDIVFLAFSREGRFLARSNLQPPGDGHSAVRDRATRAEQGIAFGYLHDITADGRYLSVAEDRSLGGRPEPLIYDRIKRTFTPALQW